MVRHIGSCKTHLAGVVVRGGMKTGNAGYYLHIQPGGRSGAAGGMHDLDSKMLLTVRKSISENFEEFTRIIENKEFIKEFVAIDKGNTLKRVPNGFKPEDPAAAYLKLKSYTVWKIFPDEDILQDSFVDKVSSTFKTLKTLNDFLNNAL